DHASSAIERDGPDLLGCSAGAAGSDPDLVAAQRPGRVVDRAEPGGQRTLSALEIDDAESAPTIPLHGVLRVGDQVAFGGETQGAEPRRRIEIDEHAPDRVL